MGTHVEVRVRLEIEDILPVSQHLRRVLRTFVREHPSAVVRDPDWVAKRLWRQMAKEVPLDDYVVKISFAREDISKKACVVCQHTVIVEGSRRP